MNGQVSLGAVDCNEDANKPLCGKYDIKGFPTLKVFPGDRTRSKKQPIDYQGAREADAIQQELLSRLPTKYVNRVTAAGGKNQLTLEQFWQSKNDTHGKLLLFTDKADTSPVVKALSLQFRSRMVFGVVRNKERELVEAFDVDHYPYMLILAPNGTALQRYKGKIKADAIADHLK